MNNMRGLAGIAEISVQIIACIFIGVFLGGFLDRLIGTSPWLIIIFSMLGVGAAIKSIFSYAGKQQ